MKIRLYLSCSRAEDIEKAKETLSLAKKYQKEGLILGIDYSGNPFQRDFNYFRPVFEEARSIGFKTLVHCAELPDAKTS
jgi:adenosine deaminase